MQPTTFAGYMVGLFVIGLFALSGVVLLWLVVGAILDAVNRRSHQYDVPHPWDCPCSECEARLGMLVDQMTADRQEADARAVYEEWHV